MTAQAAIFGYNDLKELGSKEEKGNECNNL